MPDHETQLPSSSRRQDLVKAGFVAAAVVSLYAVSRTRHFGGDDTVYALVVQRWLEVGAVERSFVHPHHLLYNPLVALASAVTRVVAGSVFVLDVGAAVSAAAAAVAVAGTYLVLRRHRVEDSASLLAVATLAVCGGMWRYATRMEVYTLAAAGVVAWLAVVSDPRVSWRRLAAGLAAPWLGHSVLALLAVPGAWLQRRRPRLVAAALLAGLVAPGVLAVVLLAWLNGARSPSGVWAIVVGRGTGRWLSAPAPLAAAAALRDLVALHTYHALPVYPQWTMTLFDTVGVLASVVLAGLVVLGTTVSVREGRGLGIAAALGIATLVPLWLVWDVGNHEHTVAAAPLFAALAAIGATAAGRFAGRAVLAAVAAGLLLVNGLGSVLLETQPQLSRTLLVADLVRDTVPEDGTLVMIGVDQELRLALPYLGGRRVVNLTALVHSARRSGASPQEALERWLQRAAAAPDTWLLENPDSPNVRQWVASLGIADQEWRDAAHQLHRGRAATLAADGVVVRETVTLRELEVVRRSVGGGGGLPVAGRVGTVHGESL